MEFLGHSGSSTGATGLLLVPAPNYPDVDVDDDDEDIVIGIRPKSSPLPRRKTSIDEEDSDISGPPSLSGSRRVSFADAVGLSLVQIKEFDKWDVPQLPDFLDRRKDHEEYFISPFNFMSSSSSEEIAAKVMDQKVELESIELLPETTILKGVVRVLNISFSKSVYMRTSLDNWVSHFDLLAEYIPGSSDGKTDSFAFKLTLVPPFAKQGARVDFCLRYETSCGTFWANNCNKNYVLFCHTRRKDGPDRPQKENVKKSCLKSVSPSFSVEESMPSPEQQNDADVTTGQKSSNDSQPKSSISCPTERSEEDGNTSQVENRRNRSRRNRRKAARAARVRDYFAQKDLTTQDSEASPQSPQTEAAQEQNKEEKHSDSKGNIQLEGNADASLPNDSNGRQHEKLNPADAAISTDDKSDESKDLSNTVSAARQNINKFVPPGGEERSPEAASDCARLSWERVDSERLVSDSGGFAFGTVVAPLYQQVSCGAGGQAHGETCSSGTNQAGEGERRSRGEMKDGKSVELCYGDGKVESIEKAGIVEATAKDGKDLEDIVKQAHRNLGNQDTIAQAQLSSSQIDEATLETSVQVNQSDFEKLPIKSNSISIQVENKALQSQISQNKCSDVTDYQKDSKDVELCYGDGKVESIEKAGIVEKTAKDGKKLESIVNQTHRNLGNQVTIAQTQMLEKSSSQRDEATLETCVSVNQSDLVKQPTIKSNSVSNLNNPNWENNFGIVASSLNVPQIQVENKALQSQISRKKCCDVTDSRKDSKDVELCYGDEKVESMEQGGAMVDVVEEVPKDGKELVNIVKQTHNIHSHLLETIAIPKDSFKGNLSSLSHILDFQEEIHEKQMSSNNQISINLAHRDEATLETSVQLKKSDIEKQPTNKSRRHSDLDTQSQENNSGIMTSSLNIAQIQVDNKALRSQISQKKSCDVTEDCKYRKDIKLCYRDEKVESIELGSGATVYIVEEEPKDGKKSENIVKVTHDIDLDLMETNMIPTTHISDIEEQIHEKGMSLGNQVTIAQMTKDGNEDEDIIKLMHDVDSHLLEMNIISMDSLNHSLSSSSHISDLDRDIHEKEMSLGNQVTIAQAQLSQSHKDETTSEPQVNLSDLEKQATIKSNSLGDLNNSSRENNIGIIASSLIIAQNQMENKASPSQISKCCGVIDEQSLELDGNTLMVEIEDKVFLSSELSNTEGLVSQFINNSNEKPSLDGGRTNIAVSSNLVFNHIHDPKQSLTLENLPKATFVDPLTKLSDTVQEINVEFGGTTLKEFEVYGLENQDEKKQSLLEQKWARNTSDESTNTKGFINDKGLDMDAGIASATSEKKSPHLTSPLAQNDCLAIHPNFSHGFDNETKASSINAPETNQEMLFLLQQDEDMENKLSKERLPKSLNQDIAENLENSSMLLGPNNNAQACANNKSNCQNKCDDNDGTTILQTLAFKLHKENPSLPLQQSQNDKITCPRILNVDRDVKMVDISQNHALTRGEPTSQSKQHLQEDELLNLNNSSDANNRVLDHKTRQTVALSLCHTLLKIKEENPLLPYQISENSNSTTCLTDSPTISNDLGTHPYEEPDFVKTATTLPNQESESSNAHNANSVNTPESIKENEAPISCLEIVDFNKNNKILCVTEITVVKAETHFCCRETDTFESDEVKDINTESKIAPQKNTVDERLKEESKNSEKMVERANSGISDLISKAENQETVQEVQPKILDDAMLQGLDLRVDIDSTEQVERTAHFETDTTEERWPQEMPCLDTNYEENGGDDTGKSTSSGVVVNEKELSVAVPSDDYLDELEARESMKVDHKKEEKLELPSITDEKERSDVLPCKVEGNLTASADNVQEDIENSRKNIEAKVTDEAEFLHSANNTRNCSVGADQVKQSTPEKEQTSDNDSNSDSESGSEDEMELYMHCLRAVCGQQSSPKATRAVQEKEFKRLSITKGKRLSTSLPSISESIDEEQQNFMQEKEPEERVEVQPSALIFPDSSHKEVKANPVRWRETFSCRNIVKTILYVTLVFLFLAVAYHYDFVACFGLYVVSVVWLYFQGEQQTGKGNRVG